MALSNRPRRMSMFLERGKSYAFDVTFTSADGKPRSLALCTVRLVLQQPQHLGGQDLITLIADHIDEKNGHSRFSFQADQLYLEPDDYSADITLVEANGYSVPIVKLDVVIGENTDDNIDNVYSWTVPPDGIQAVMDGVDVISVMSTALPGEKGDKGDKGDTGDVQGVFVQPDQPAEDDIAPPHALWVDTDEDPEQGSPIADQQYVDDAIAANSFADRAHSDIQDDIHSSADRAYADAEDAWHSTADRAYADNEDAKHSTEDRAYADQQDDIHSASDRAYADQQDAAHSTQDRIYTDQRVASNSSADRAYADWEDDRHSAADRQYTDTQVAESSTLDRVYSDAEDDKHSAADRTYADQQDDAHSAQDRIYTDQRVASNSSADRAYADARYVNSAGDTMTGNLIMQGTYRSQEFKNDAGSRVALFAGPGQPLRIQDVAGGRNPLIYHDSGRLSLAGSAAVEVPAPTGAGQAAQVTAIDPTTGRLAIGGTEMGDTGWRSVFTDPTNGFTGMTVWLRRTGNIVHSQLFAAASFDDAKTSNVFHILTSGWRPKTSHGIAEFGHPRASNQMLQVRNTGQMEFPFSVTGSTYMAVSWSTSDPWPTALPGTPS
jgi:hypothetical protein